MADCRSSMLECVGGYGLLLLGLGVLAFVPSCLLFGLYVDESGTNMQPISITLFVTSLVSVFLGAIIVVFWLRTSRNKKADPNDSCSDLTKNEDPENSTGQVSIKMKSAQSGRSSKAGADPDTTETGLNGDSPSQTDA